MKKLLVGAAALVAMMATGANAQTYQTFSDGSGSSTTYVNPGNRDW
jgi:hypothetical protein